MILFDDDKVLLLHQILAEVTGGAMGVRDRNLLNSALSSVYATFDGVELYPTKQEKAARLAYGLISNHPFVDGNKRIGIYVMLTFLALNGIKLVADNDEVVKLGLGIADGQYNYEYVLQWINEHVGEQI